MDDYDNHAILAMLAEYQPEPNVRDIERIRQLMQVSIIMIEQNCSHTEATRLANLSPSTVYRWREARPWVHSIASRLMLAQMDREIDDTVLAHWKEGLLLLCKDFVNPLVKPEVRLAIQKQLHQLHIQPLADELEAMETALAQSKEQKAMVRRRRNYQPATTLVATIVLPDGRSVLPGSRAVEGEYEVITELDADETDEQLTVLE